MPIETATSKFCGVTFLPIVVRELRVAARKRRTFWLRVVAALVALIIGAGMLILSSAGAFPGATLGGVLFGILTWMLLITALAAGAFFTADCLSEEKREGTLGFLFLTDLRGYDVTGGKLLATSLRVFYALLAVFPVLAISLTMGGVTGVQFWKTTLALMNALFCSLTAGMFVSSISRESQKALGGTLFVIFLWAAGGPIADGIIAAKKGMGFAPYYSLSSPYYMFGQADSWGKSSYWTGLMITQGLAWTLFAIASFQIQRAWQEKRPRAGSGASALSYGWRYGGRQRRDAIRQKLVGLNPVLWLVCRERWQSSGVWAILILLAGPIALCYAMEVPEVAVMLWKLVGSICVWVLYLWASSQASRFFIEARRSGMMELLLATPLTVGEILRGQWRALGRLFGLPTLLILGIIFFGALAGGSSSIMRSFSRPGVGPGWERDLLMALLNTLGTTANLAALLWFGMWMGLTSKNFSLATLKTFGFVQVIPSLIISFASMIFAAMVILPALSKLSMQTGAAGGAATSTLFGWYPLLTMLGTCVLTVLKDVAFVAWARHRMNHSFRQQASRTFMPVPVVPPRIPMPPPIAVPPLPPPRI